jgi:D-3-phosphoglycerate dehydrogenase
MTAEHVPPSILTEDVLVNMAKDAAAILVIRAPITARIMDALPTLRVIGRYGVGVDNVDAAAATERGIAVVYAPAYCAREVADHTMMFILACSRKLRLLDQSLRRGEWSRDAASPIGALYSAVLGLVGLGHIGREVARRALACGMTVIAYDPYLWPGAQPPEIPLVSLAELLGRADFLSLHTPLTAETRRILGRHELHALKRSAYVINTSRGALIDEDALVEALESGTIAGAALDVFATEPLPSGSRLLRCENVLLTPHTGGISDEGGVLLRKIVAGAVAQVLAGEWPKGAELFNPDVKGRR